MTEEVEESGRLEEITTETDVCINFEIFDKATELKGVSGRQLSIDSGIAQHTISKLIRHINVDMKISTLRQLEKALKVSEGKLFIL